MNKLFQLLLLIFVFGCSDNSDTKKHHEVKVPEKSTESPIIDTGDNEIVKPVNKEYNNARFRNVTIMKVAPDSYQITGQGQIFEASFNWVVEDGHNELKHGYQSTDAGAPEWGNFNFKLQVAKERPNSTL